MKVSSLFKKYLKTKKLEYTSVKAKEGAARHFVKYCGNIAAEKVSYQIVEDFQSYMSKKVKNTSVNSYIANIAAAFSWAVLRNDIPEITSNPFSELKKLKEQEKEWKTYAPAEIREILKVAELEVAIVISLGICGGLRRSEALNLILNEVDFEDETISVGPKKETAETWFWQSKTRNRIKFKMPVFLRNLILRKCDTMIGPYISLPNDRYKRMLERMKDGTIKDTHRKNPWQNLNRKLDKTLKLAGVDHKTIHDLRKSYGTFLVRQGLNIREAQLALGHKKISTTSEYYVQVDKERLQERTFEMVQNFITEL